MSGYYYHDPLQPLKNLVADILETVSFILQVVLPVSLLILSAAVILVLVGRYRRAGLSIGLEGRINGIIFGRFFQSKYIPPKIRLYSKITDEGHVGIFGGSGFGKTSALLIPSLRAMLNPWFNEHGGFAGSLTIDISGDISSNVDASNKVVFDPLDPSSIPYNVFGIIDKMASDSQKNDALSQLAYLIIPENHSDSAAANYFRAGSRNILIASLIAFYHEGWDFLDICRHIVDMSPPDLFSKIDATGNRDAIMYINGFARADGSVDNNVAGCKESCNTAVLLFATNSTLASTMRRSSAGEDCITPESLESEHVFVCIDEDYIDLLSPVMRIISAQCIQYLSQRPLHMTSMIGVFLDEFKAIGPIADFAGAMARLRKRHVRIVVLTQSLADLEEIYSLHGRKSMINNMKYIVLLNVREVDEQEYFARMIGKHKVKKYSRHGLFGFGDVTVSSEEDYKVNPSDLANLGDRLVLLYPGGYIRLWKNYYFK